MRENKKNREEARKDKEKNGRTGGKRNREKRMEEV